MRLTPYIRFHHSGDVTIKAGNRLGPRSLSDYELVYFPAGNNTVYASSLAGELPLTKPCVLITRPTETHHYQFDPVEPTRHLFIHFDINDQRALERYPVLAIDSAHSRIDLHQHSLIPHLMKQLLYYFHHKPTRWRLVTETLFLSILEEMESTIAEHHSTVPESQPVPAPVFTALQYIESHINDPIEIKELADASGWSHEHFTRTFQRHVGHPPKEWINKRKIERAAQLLLQRTESVKEVARELGFMDEYYFHRLFRRWMGMTSTQYRKRYGDPRLRELVPVDDWSRFYPLNHFFVLDHPDHEG